MILGYRIQFVIRHPIMFWNAWRLRNAEVINLDFNPKIGVSISDKVVKPILQKVK